MPDWTTDVTQQLGQVLGYQIIATDKVSVTVLGVLLSALFVLGFVILRRKFNVWAAAAIDRSRFEGRTKNEILLASKFVLYPVGLFILLRLLGVDRWLFHELVTLQGEVRSVVDLKLFTIGKTELTLWTVMYLLILSWLLVRLTGQCENWFMRRVLSRTRLETGMASALGAIFRYAVVTIGMIVIIQSAGIDLSALTIMAGGLAVAIGLALQSIANNLISGLVILFERPIKVGDRIDVGGVVGDVSHVSLRATTIITNDNIAIIVPNSEFITSKVVNWTYSGRQCRFSFPLRVAPDSDPQLVKDLLLQVALEDQNILQEPAPKVLFEDRSETALNFSLSVWSTEYVKHPSDLRSNLNFAVAKKLAEHGVQQEGQKNAKASGVFSVRGDFTPHKDTEVPPRAFEAKNPVRGFESK